jgi:hypothetical protein
VSQQDRHDDTLPLMLPAEMDKTVPTSGNL